MLAYNFTNSTKSWARVTPSLISKRQPTAWPFIVFLVELSTATERTWTAARNLKLKKFTEISASKFALFWYAAPKRVHHDQSSWNDVHLESESYMNSCERHARNVASKSFLWTRFPVWIMNEPSGRASNVSAIILSKCRCRWLTVRW